VLRGGRIFAVLAAGGGVLTCRGAVSTRVRAYPSGSSFDDGVVLRPLTDASPILPLVALGAGLTVAALAIAFIVLRRTRTRAVLAIVLITVGVITALAFTELRIGGASTLVPAGVRDGLPVCDRETGPPCLNVYWPTETIVWGGWIAAFWGGWALIRVRPRPPRARARADSPRPEVVHQGPPVSAPSGPSAAWQASSLRADPTPHPRRPRSWLPRSDLGILAWLIGAVAGAAVLFVAGFVILFALFYGDHEDPEITDSRPGPALFLTADAPAASAGFTFEANAAALEKPGYVLLAFEWRAFWSGGTRDRTAFTPEIVGGGGFEPTEDGDFVCYGPECLGTYEARLEWPADLETGSVRIEWTVTANISYPSGMADGASVRARVERLFGAEPPVRVAGGSIAMGAEHPYVAQDTLIIRTTGPIPQGAELAVEIDPTLLYAAVAFGDDVDVLLLQPLVAPVPLPPSSSTSLSVPASCRAGPCSFTVSLVGELRSRLSSSVLYVQWGVTARGVGGSVAVTSEEAAVARTEDRLELGPVLLEDGRSEEFPVSIRIPAGALPVAEFEVSDPVVDARLFFGPPDDPKAFPDDADLEIQVSFPSDPSAGFSTLRGDYNMGFPVTFPVPNSCRPGEDCEVQVIISLTARGHDAPIGEPVELRPTLDIALAYPVTALPPAGADLEVAVGPGQA
jgi:hypothetical protein